jgi:hypothetical protein
MKIRQNISFNSKYYEYISNKFNLNANDII